MQLIITDSRLQKEITPLLEQYEVNEQARPVITDDKDGLRVFVTSDPCLELKKAITPETTLTIFSATPLFDEGGCVRILLNDNTIKPNQLVYVGLRRMTKGEALLLGQKNIRTYSMNQISFQGHQETCDGAMQASRSKDHLILLIDLSVLDPACNPGSQEPGGMTSRELIYFLQRFKLLKNLKEVIITGYGQETSLSLIAKVIVELT
jgi:hypothetical protein